jgi:hypothetical protein
MTWCIDPSTFALTGGTPPRTLSEFAAQEWPPCPVCGTAIEVDAVAVPVMGSRESGFMMGQWYCSRGCDPKRRPVGSVPELGEPFRTGVVASVN